MGEFELDLVHNDVKPANVLLGRDGSLKLTRFGVSQMVTALGVEQGETYGTLDIVPPGRCGVKAAVPRPVTDNGHATEARTSGGPE